MMINNSQNGFIYFRKKNLCPLVSVVVRILSWSLWLVLRLDHEYISLSTSVISELKFFFKHYPSNLATQLKTGNGTTYM